MFAKTGDLTITKISSEKKLPLKVTVLKGLKLWEVLIEWKSAIGSIHAKKENAQK